MTDIYGTIGPACAKPELLEEMFRLGMTGIRLNTSHISVREAAPQIRMIQEAAAACGKKAKLLIDMQGPELRIGKMDKLSLEKGQIVRLYTKKSGHHEGDDSTKIHEDLACSSGSIEIPDIVFAVLAEGQEVLLDDGKILLKVQAGKNTTPARSESAMYAVVLRGGILSGGKSIAVPGTSINPPAMTEQDRLNIKDAVSYGITGVMQPFVRSEKDLEEVKTALKEAGGEKIALLAKIENMSGVENLECFFGLADEIVIARGDLGNAMPLWELPRVQKDIERRCKAAGVPYMVVTQMLASMEHNAVPTRAEVSDIYHAVCHGAASVMVTGETAVGEYPVEVIRYLVNTVRSYHDSLENSYDSVRNQPDENSGGK